MTKYFLIFSVKLVHFWILTFMIQTNWVIEIRHPQTHTQTNKQTNTHTHTNTHIHTFFNWYTCVDRDPHKDVLKKINRAPHKRHFLQTRITKSLTPISPYKKIVYENGEARVFYNKRCGFFFNFEGPHLYFAGPNFKIMRSSFYFAGAPFNIAGPLFNIVRPSFFIAGSHFNIARPLSTLWEPLPNWNLSFQLNKALFIFSDAPFQLYEVCFLLYRTWLQHCAAPFYSLGPPCNIFRPPFNLTKPASYLLIPPLNFSMPLSTFQGPISTLWGPFQ